MRKYILPLILGFTISLLGENPIRVQASPNTESVNQYYDIGTPVLSNIYVSPTGSNENDGQSAETPFQTIGAAWRSIPETTLSGTGFQINLLPGSYPCEGDCNNYFSDRHGTYQYPVIIKALNGPGTVEILGGFNIANVDYMYLIDLTLIAGGGYPRFANNVLHCESCNRFLIRGVTLRGPNPDTDYEIQEVIKVNQSQYVYIEDSDASGSYQNILDFFSVQYGHVINNRFHHSGDWCGYVKGGSAYLLFEGNEFDHCRLGFSAGEGSNLEVMVNPWIHYEAYDIKFINNILHDIVGLGMRAAGGYNILFAYNTLYKVATDTNIGYSLIHITHGARGCEDTSENGTGNGQAICNQKLNAGGWGPTHLMDSLEIIPNRNVFVYNNIFYNPDLVNGGEPQFYIVDPATPPSSSRNMPNPSEADTNLQIRGNVIWNKPDERDLGAGGEGQGCKSSNVSCTAAQILADNTINTIEPELSDPDHGDFRPVGDSNILAVTIHNIPDFTWGDAPAAPSVPAGQDSNSVTYDMDGNTRPEAGPPGAYTGCDATIPVARLLSPEGVTITKRPQFHWVGVNGATSYLVRLNGPTGVSTISLNPETGGCLNSVDECTNSLTEDIGEGFYSWQVETTTSEGSRWSSAMDFRIFQPALPLINSIKPTRARVYDRKFWVTIRGTNFGKNAVVFWGSTGLHTHRLSSTRITALVTTDLYLKAGISEIKVRNPDSMVPEGIYSDSKYFSVENPKPTISRVYPRTLFAGSPETTIRVDGNNFVEGAVVRWNGSDLTTSFVNRKRLIGIVPEGNLALMGKVMIYISNPAPGGGYSRNSRILVK